MNRIELIEQVAGPMPPFIRELRDKIRKGLKTQTRRIINPQPYQDENGHWFIGNDWDGFGGDGIPDYKLHKCPYGKAGQLRYLREPLVCDTRGFARYEDDDALVFDLDGEPVVWRWKTKRLSQIFLPKELVRTFVNLNEIRGELVQSISVHDAIAEGISEKFLGPSGDKQIIDRFITLWDKINRQRGYGWEKPRWVWVLGFSLYGGE